MLLHARELPPPLFKMCVYAPQSDILDALFGGGRGRRDGGGGRRQGPDVSFDLNLSLEDMYNGTVKKLKLARNIICSECQGKGGKGDVKPCQDCRGRGVKVMIRQLGPGMIQQVQTHCGSCGGEGTVIPPGSRYVRACVCMCGGGDTQHP